MEKKSVGTYGIGKKSVGFMALEKKVLGLLALEKKVLAVSVLELFFGTFVAIPKKFCSFQNKYE